MQPDNGGFEFLIYKFRLNLTCSNEPSMDYYFWEWHNERDFSTEQTGTGGAAEQFKYLRKEIMKNLV